MLTPEKLKKWSILFYLNNKKVIESWDYIVLSFSHRNVPYGTVIMLLILFGLHWVVEYSPLIPVFPWTGKNTFLGLTHRPKAFEGSPNTLCYCVTSLFLLRTSILPLKSTYVKGKVSRRYDFNTQFRILRVNWLAPLPMSVRNRMGYR